MENITNRSTNDEEQRGKHYNVEACKQNELITPLRIGSMKNMMKNWRA